MSGFWNIVLTILGWLSLPMFAFSVWLLIRSVKKDRRVRVLTLVIPLVTTVLVPVIYVAILGVDGPRILSGFLFVVGVPLGLWWADTTDLTRAEDDVMGKRSPWYLVVWGVSFGVTQLMALVASETLVALGISTMYFSMGVAIATNTSLLVRRRTVAKGGVDRKIVAAALAAVRTRTASTPAQP